MISGIIKSIGPEIQVSATFKKREFVIETVEQYPNFILFELINDRTDIIDPYKEGQSVTVDYNLKGRQWTSPQGELKTFNTIVAWKIQPLH